ncbi:MAG: hypothetical protein JSW64_07640 [Candidatus Zixiibacteriota bacterium]|nr:MAG: hypothetical protein JSW64_07640 [candidate division Zixibacteria bacterium]
MSKYKKLDLSRAKTIKSSRRKVKADISNFGKALDPEKTVSEFLNSLPAFLKAADLMELSEKIARAKIEGKTIIWMMGAHPVKVGLSPVFIDLLEKGFVSHLAVSGAFMIHDIEIAFFGRTSEDVAEGIGDGSFGMVEETPQMLFEAAGLSKNEGLGLGEGVGRYIETRSPEFKDYSILMNCHTRDIPVSVHLAVGTDTISQHPGFDGGLFGKMSADDFLIMAHSVSGLAGGVVINFGSAVVLPEVFLKALTAARNIKGKIENFAAANFDMIQHYRPNVNVVGRPVSGSGRGYSITGHHEIMMPLLAAAIKHKYKEMSERS